MDRRGFLTGLLVTITTRTVQAQQPAKVRRVVFVAVTARLRPGVVDPSAKAFVESLMALGHVPGTWCWSRGLSTESSSVCLSSFASWLPSMWMSSSRSRTQ